MAKVLINLGVTGKVIGDLTWRWCKTMSDNSDVSTDDSTLTERGNGAYVLENPNVTGDTDFEVYVTGAETYYAQGIFAEDIPITSNIKKNQALSNFPFSMVQSADHIIPATGLTITAERSIDGAAFAACENSPAEISNGEYKIDLAASDMNGSVIILKFTATGADMEKVKIITQP